MGQTFMEHPFILDGVPTTEIYSTRIRDNPNGTTDYKSCRWNPEYGLVETVVEIPMGAVFMTQRGNVFRLDPYKVA